MLLMESVSKIRRWVLVEGRSIRSVARATGLSRNTIKKYLKDESPPSYQRQAPPVRHKLCNGFDLRLQELFDQDQKRPRRERRTATKLYEQLVSEGYTGSCSPVQRFVRDLKRADAGSGEAFIPLHFAAGVSDVRHKEDEGMGLCAGAYMGGARPAIFMQNTALASVTAAAMKPS